MPVAADKTGWRFVHFGLFVTGKGEEEFLPDLFRHLMRTGCCTFKVLRRIDQRSPIRSAKRKQKLVVGGKRIPSKDEEIGLEARAFLQRRMDSYVLVIDDLERNRASEVEAVFQRYRLLLDTMLGPLKARASVHFLTNMLEAYYFAHAAAINAVLGTTLTDWEGDVETIPHPKKLLTQNFRGFHQIDHGKKILALLDVPHVLSRPAACASLRTIFGWCVRALGLPFGEDYRLSDGRLHPLTGPQIDTLPDAGVSKLKE